MNIVELQEQYPEIAQLWYDAVNANFAAEYIHYVIKAGGPYNGSYGTVMETRTKIYLGKYTNAEEARVEMEELMKIHDKKWREYIISSKLIS